MKSVVLHALLAALGLGFAYQTWTRPAVLEEKPREDVTLLACKPEQLTEIELIMPTHRVKVWPEQGKNGREYWLTTTPTPVVKPAASEGEPAPADPNSADAAVASSSATDAGAPGAPNAAAKPSATKKESARNYDPKEPVTFVANAAFDMYLANNFPVRALRGLGVIDKKEHAEFGLDKVGTFLRVRCGAQTLALDIAGRTHGTNDHYVRDPKTDQSYLLAGRLVRDLQSAQFNFTQSELHAFKLADVDETVLTAMGSSKRLLQRDRMNPAQAQWVDADHPDRKNELFGNWLDRLAKLRVRLYLKRNEGPGADLKDAAAPVEALTVEHHLGGKPKGKLEIVRVDAGGIAYYYARSEATRVWVSLYEAVVKDLMHDLGVVISGEDVSESGDPAASPTPPPAAKP
jgi:hypothetical protein